jgi:tRNA threonylcarbamoyladenosine biosynthesis protein TsaB
MKLLALDTATETLALGLAWGDRCWTLNLAGGAAASQQIIPSILGLLAQAGLALADLDGIAFGQGPGAFTGVRTAVSVTQGLAFGLGVPVVAVDSLQILAEDAAAQVGAEALREGDVFWALADARMGEIYAAAYAWSPDAPGAETAAPSRWKTVFAPALLSLEATNEALLAWPPRCAAGSALAAFSDSLRLPPGTESFPDLVDRAQALLRLARAAWQAGLRVPAEQALPVYLRDKVAQTTAERERDRQTKRGLAGGPGVVPAAV